MKQKDICHLNLKLDLTIKHIADEILLSRSRCNLNSNFGLFTGRMGILLFTAEYYSRNNEDIYYNFLQQEIIELFKEIEKGNISNFSLSTGLSGILMGILMLKKYDFIDFDTSDLSIFSEILFKHLMIEVNQNHFDYLHGAFGILNYFIYTIDDVPNNIKYIERALIELSRKKISHNNGIYWNNEIKTMYNNTGINLSLSHGQSGFIAVLSNLKEICNKKNIQILLIDDLLLEATKLYGNIFDKLVFREAKYNFPDWIRSESNAIRGRLAWCYGDLGTISVIFKTAKLLQNHELSQICLKILVNTTLISHQDSGVVDTGICHGSAGIAHLYNKLYRSTMREEFKESANYWIGETLNMTKFKDGLAGYKAWQGKELGWQNEYGLLEGIAGVGLVLLAHISDEEPTWDRCLLLS